MEKFDVSCMIRFVESDFLKVGSIQTFKLIWWDLSQANQRKNFMYDTQYDYGESLQKIASKVNFHVSPELDKSVCY